MPAHDTSYTVTDDIYYQHRYVAALQKHQWHHHF